MAREELLCPQCDREVSAGTRFCPECFTDLQEHPPSTLDERLDAVEAWLRQETGGWTQSILVRTYDATDEGHEDYLDEAEILAPHGYEPSMQSVDGGHINIGRVLLFGAWTALAGNARSAGTLTVTYRRTRTSSKASSTNPDPLAQLEQLGKLRDAGYISTQEFEAKKRELLSRF